MSNIENAKAIVKMIPTLSMDELRTLEDLMMEARIKLQQELKKQLSSV